MAATKDSGLRSEHQCGIDARAAATATMVLLGATLIETTRWNSVDWEVTRRIRLNGCIYKFSNSRWIKWPNLLESGYIPAPWDDLPLYAMLDFIASRGTDHE